MLIYNIAYWLTDGTFYGIKCNLTELLFAPVVVSGLSYVLAAFTAIVLQWALFCMGAYL